MHFSICFSWSNIVPISIFAIAHTQNDFSQGPYGNGSFDIAAPFSLVDLNTDPEGDINDDEITNIQDIIDQLENDLVGLTPVKQRIKEIAALLLVQRLRRKDWLIGAKSK